MGSRAEGTGLMKPGLINFVGADRLVPAQGNNLSIRVYLHGHQLNTILVGS